MRTHMVEEFQMPSYTPVLQAARLRPVILVFLIPRCGSLWIRGSCVTARDRWSGRVFCVALQLCLIDPGNTRLCRSPKTCNDDCSQWPKNKLRVKNFGGSDGRGSHARRKCRPCTLPIVHFAQHMPRSMMLLSGISCIPALVEQAQGAPNLSLAMALSIAMVLSSLSRKSCIFSSLSASLALSASSFLNSLSLFFLACSLMCLLIPSSSPPIKSRSPISSVPGSLASLNARLEAATSRFFSSWRSRVPACARGTRSSRASFWDLRSCFRW